MSVPRYGRRTVHDYGDVVVHRPYGDVVPNCPACGAGFSTRGDANDRYDRATPLAGPVHPDWTGDTAGDGYRTSGTSASF